MPTGQVPSLLRILLVPGVLALFTTAYFVEALRLGSPIRYGVPSASFMPILLSVIMYAALAAVVIRSFRQRHLIPASSSVLGRATTVPVLVVLASAFYVFFFTRLGVSISTLLYVYALLSLFGYHSGRTLGGQARRVLAAVVISAAVYVFFVVVFRVQLPTILEFAW